MTVIAFRRPTGQARRQRPDASTRMPGEGATILFFTGIRYERLEPARRPGKGKPGPDRKRVS